MTFCVLPRHRAGCRRFPHGARRGLDPSQGEGPIRMLAVIAAMLTLLIASTTKATAAPRPPRNIARAIWHAHVVYGAPYQEMLAVAWCESRYSPTAIGDGSHGLFQFLRGTWARTPFGRKYIYSPWWNALAAAWLWRHDGRSWHEWTCGRLNGLA